MFVRVDILSLNIYFGYLFDVLDAGSNRSTISPPPFLPQVFGIICMACASPALIGGTHWFLFVVVTSFIATVLWSFVYLLGIREVLNLPINWILTVGSSNNAWDNVLYMEVDPTHEK